MARSSHPLTLLMLLLVSSSCLTGCLVAEAPEYGAQRKSPIFIVPDSIDPNPAIIRNIDTSNMDQPISFSLSVRSEDAGERFVVAIYQNYTQADENFITWINPPALTFANVRKVSVQVQPEKLFFAPCTTLTLLLLRADEWDSVALKPLQPLASDSATVTWYMTVNDDPAHPVPANECPNLSGQARGVN